MTYDVIVVGGGISGLTAAAYSSKEAYKTLLIEQEEKTGGLVSTFKVKDYTFDGGIRSIENSGIVRPMLKQLGIEIEFLDSVVSMGIEDDVIKITSKDSVEDYRKLLYKAFPDHKNDVDKIVKEVYKIMKYLDILYGIDNPLFLDFKTNKKYFITTILPWMFKYAFTFRKIEKLSIPVDEYLDLFTDNQSLKDVIGQHFFYKTPAFFAMSYFSLYLDYKYPKGGTSRLVEAIDSYIKEQGGDIKVKTKVVSVDPNKKEVTDQDGNTYRYKKLIWSADLRFLYKNLLGDKTKEIQERQKEVEDKRGGDSIQAVFLGTNLPKEFYAEKCTGHFFYTPYKTGLHQSFKSKAAVDFTNKEQGLKWLKEYYQNNTYEIAIPGLRDDSLAPKGKTGLVVSALMDYSIVKTIVDAGWYDDYKKYSEEAMVSILNETIFKGFKDYIEVQFSSSPLTIYNRTGNSHGAITGWAFDNKTMPAVTSMPGIAKSVDTPIPNVYQSGQWTYSPAGLPISILTGKLAFDKVHKDLKKESKL
jgi:phytoene dehydrogenase-like protein